MDALPSDAQRWLEQSMGSPHVTPKSATPALELTAGKNEVAYRAHAYHTKVPPEALAALIERYTSPGALVIDVFAGSGMTGVAALKTGRRAILSDISPAAVHIARNYTTRCDADELRRAIKLVEAQVRPTIDRLYRVPGRDGGVVEYMVWSDIFVCPSCRDDLVYWDAARDRRGAVRSTGVRCERCRRAYPKRGLRWVGERPVLTSLAQDNGRRDSHPPTRAELQLSKRANALTIPHWTPDVPFGSEREMWRAAHSAAGIKSVADFFTRRNLHALAAIRSAILVVEDARLREALLFALTGCINRASKRYQWNAKRPTNVMAGTLYVSSLRYEWNVWSLFRRKAEDVARYYAWLGSGEDSCVTAQSSACALEHLPDGCADLAIMDPPFGSNIYYGDCSLLWEAWLGELTDLGAELVVGRRRPDGKTLEQYEALLSSAFRQTRRKLKAGAPAVLVFSNTDDAVWQAIQRAIVGAGFRVNGATLLDKVQPSIKGVKGRQQRERVTSYDLVLELVSASAKPRAPKKVMLDTVVARCLARVGTDERRPDRLYAHVLRELLATGRSLAGVTIDAVNDAVDRIRRSKGKTA